MIDTEDQVRLLEVFPPPSDWVAVCTHMTINMGNISPSAGVKLGDRIPLKIVAVGKDQRAYAVKVEVCHKLIFESEYIVLGFCELRKLYSSYYDCTFSQRNCKG